ncbi:hypothetical protein LH464_11925 [Neorhizobium sp. T786]|uniref:hypothetical protein n=1 Tax=Pseudorhizobium xiangyangii TaxID=2883104 RepID=UPI001CFFE9A0|nr:hypothetical protein [Neorhizobium xiangyangii]MCB5203178.1 hypothetical protein [Neorhizobium xiangyangii]
MEKVVIPFGAYQLRTEASSIEALAALHAALSPYSAAEIKIDCTKLGWFDAHLAAPFMTVMNHSRTQSNSISLTGLADNVSLILRKNGMLARKAEDSYHTTIPVTSFGLDEEIEFADYSRKHLARREMPRMSQALVGKFFEGLDELFANCALHSKSEINVVAAGQFFPRAERLAFAISDGGRGVDGSLRASGITYSSPEDAIDWAMQNNNTTRQGYVPGGLGLKLLREFIAKNNGKLMVASSAGLWTQTGTRLTKARMPKPFPGTVVIMEILTSDRNVYDLKASTDHRNIW